MMRLFERDEQAAAMGGYRAEAATGHGRMVFVAGEAGVGKTTFVRRVLDDAAGLACIAVGGCDGSSTPAPLGPLVEMLPKLPAHVWPSEATRHEVFARLVAELREPASGEPYLLVVEDAHWADEATMDLVRHLARRVHDCRALVLVTYRPEDVTAGHPLRMVLGDAATASGVRRLDLPGLSRAAVRLLAADHAATHPEAAAADVDRLHRVTGGNPFFVTEALSAGTGEVPATVRDAVLARVARLSAPARAALDVVALLGARAEHDLLATTLDDGPDVLDEPLQRGLLDARPGEVTFRHELARLAVAVQVPTFRRIAIHRRILRALLDREPGPARDPARLAHHAEAAGVAEAVLAHAPEAAAVAAELGSHREAVRQYQRTLRFADGMPDERRAQLLWALGYECYLTDQIDDALGAVQAALTIWQAAGDEVRVGDAYRCLSRLSWFAGRNDVAERQADLAVHSLQGSDTVELAMAYSNIAQLRMLSSDLEGARAWGGRALAALDRLPDGQKRTEVRVHALNNLGTAEVVSGDQHAGIRMLTSSLDQARAADLHEHAARAYCNLVSCAVVQRRHTDAAAQLVAGLDYCIDRDLDSWTLYLLGLQAQLMLNRGETAAARQCAEKVLQRTESAPTSQIEPLVVLALTAARAGDPGWREPVDLAVRLADGIGEIQRLGPVTAARCEIAWLAGEVESPPRLAAQTWPKATGADCPWNRGSIATWLGDPTAGDGAPLAPPYALEVSGPLGRGREPLAAPGLPARTGAGPCPQRRPGCHDRCGRAVRRARVVRGGRPDPCAAAGPGVVGPAGRPDQHPRAPGRTDRARGAGARAAGRAPVGRRDRHRLVLSRRTVEHHVAAILAKFGVALPPRGRPARRWVPRPPGIGSPHPCGPGPGIGRPATTTCRAPRAAGGHRRGPPHATVHGHPPPRQRGHDGRRREGAPGRPRRPGRARREVPALLGRRGQGRGLLPGRGARCASRERGPPQGPRPGRRRHPPGTGRGLTMLRRRTVSLATGTVTLAAAAALTLGLGPSRAADEESGPLDQVRRATSGYRDVSRALAAGYVQFFGCVHEPLAGAMGTHFVNAALVGDGKIDAARPEALMYDIRPDGRLDLLGAEYVVFKDAWDSTPLLAAGAVRADLRHRGHAEPVRAATLLRAACLGLEGEPHRREQGLESPGDVHQHRGPRPLNLPPSARIHGARSGSVVTRRLG